MNFDRGNEELKRKEADPRRSLLTTLGSSLIVSCLISTLGTFYILFRSEHAMVYWLCFMIPYGVLAVAGFSFGFLCIFLKKWRMPLALIGAILGALLGASGIVNGIFLGDWTIAGSILVIGGCVFAIGLLSFLQLKE